MRTLMQYEIPVISGGLTNSESVGVGLGALSGGAIGFAARNFIGGYGSNLLFGGSYIAAQAIGFAGVLGFAAVGGLLGYGITVSGGYLSSCLGCTKVSSDAGQVTDSAV